MSELRRDLLTSPPPRPRAPPSLKPSPATSPPASKPSPPALKDGVKDSAQITSKLTSESQAAMSLELKNTREQINQIQNQLGEVQQAGQQMFQTAQTLENIFGRPRNPAAHSAKSPWNAFSKIPWRLAIRRQYRFRSGEAADAVIFLLDKKRWPSIPNFPWTPTAASAPKARKPAAHSFTAVKNHADSISKKYIVPDEDTLDVALMFVPSETVFYELLMSVDGKASRSTNIAAAAAASFPFRQTPCTPTCASSPWASAACRSRKTPRTWLRISTGCANSSIPSRSILRP